MLFEGLVEINPKDAAAHAALGTVYQKLGRLEEAMASYSAAIGLDSTQPVALSNRGELRLKQHDRGGIQDLVAAAQSDPSGITVAGRRARALISVVAEAAREQSAGS